jgi:amphi-Trp domain-containing protein
MAKSKIKTTLARAEAANRLAGLAQALRDGSVSLNGGPKVAVAEQVELKADLDDDELEIELRWRPAKEPRLG